MPSREPVAPGAEPDMPQSYEHSVIDARQSTAEDNFYNLKKLAELSIVYFEKHHTAVAAIVESSKPFEERVDNENILQMLEESTKKTATKDRKCSDCGKCYSTSSNLARHRQTHRSLADTKARRCPQCNKLFLCTGVCVNTSLLNAHAYTQSIV